MNSLKIAHYIASVRKKLIENKIVFVIFDFFSCFSCTKLTNNIPLHPEKAQ